MQDSNTQLEFEIIHRYFSRKELAFAREGVELGIGDDAALIDVPAHKHLAMSLDVLVAGVHFPEDAAPALIANRALAVNLSDLAAMAAEPFCFTLGLTLPKNDIAWIKNFSEGLEALAQQYNCPLVGGDTSSGPLSVAIQVQGLVDKSSAARRKGARVGDSIYVTGALGDGAIALLALGLDSHLGEDFALSVESPSAACQRYFEAAFYKPRPQIDLALAASKLLSSSIDISDGLHGDLQHILEASEVGADIHLTALPYSDSAQCCTDEANRMRAALFGGDDYALCFTVAENDRAELERIADRLGGRISRIGVIVEGEGISYLQADGSAAEINAHSFQHFQTD